MVDGWGLEKCSDLQLDMISMPDRMKQIETALEERVPEHEGIGGCDFLSIMIPPAKEEIELKIEK